MKMHYNLKLDKLIDYSFIFYNIALYLFDLNPTYILISYVCFITFSLLVILKLMKMRTIKIGIYFYLPVIFLIYSFASISWSLSSQLALNRFITLFLVFILYFLTYNNFSIELKLGFIIKTQFISGIALCIYTFFIYGYETIFFSLINNIRLGGDIGQINVFGMNLATTVIICIYYFLFKGKKILLPISVIPFVLAMSSGSRKSLIIIVVGVIALIYFRYGFKKLYKSILYTLITLSLLFFIINLPMFSNILQRFKGLYSLISSSGAIEASALVRQDYINLGWDWFLKKPFFGYGLNNSSFLLLIEYGYNTYLHNNFVEMLINGGVLSFILYYSFNLYIIFKLFRKIKSNNHEAFFIFLLLFIRFVLDFAAVSYYEKSTWLYFAFGFIALKEVEDLQNVNFQQKL